MTLCKGNLTDEFLRGVLRTLLHMFCRESPKLSELIEEKEKLLDKEIWFCTRARKDSSIMFQTKSRDCIVTICYRRNLSPHITMALVVFSGIECVEVEIQIQEKQPYWKFWSKICDVLYSLPSRLFSGKAPI